MTKYFAFVDETRAKRYRLCLVKVPDWNVEEFRSAMKDLRLRGQRRLHMKNENESRQWEIVNCLLANSHWKAWIFESRLGSRITSETRQELFLLAAQHRSWLDVSNLVVEDSTDSRRDAKTLSWLQKNGLHTFSYAILKAHNEPGLWAADAIAWAYARGGSFRQEIKGRVEVISGP